MSKDKKEIHVYVHGERENVAETLRVLLEDAIGTPVLGETLDQLPPRKLIKLASCVHGRLYLKVDPQYRHWSA